MYAEFTSALCPETWVVADGTVTPLLRGAHLEGSGEEHSEAVASELAAALEEKVHISCLGFCVTRQYPDVVNIASASSGLYSPTATSRLSHYRHMHGLVQPL